MSGTKWYSIFTGCYVETLQPIATLVGGYLAYTFSGHSPSEREVRAGLQRELKQKPQRKDAYWPSPGSSLVNVLIHPSPTYLETVPPG